MRDNGATWTAQVQAALAARQQVDACIQALGTPPDWTPVRTAFANLFTVLEELWQEVQAMPNRLQVLPESLRKHVLAVSDWKELEKEKPIELLVDLWQGWTTGILAARYFQEESELRAVLLMLYVYSSINAYEKLNDFISADQLFCQGIVHGERFLATSEMINSGVQKWLLNLYCYAAIILAVQRDRIKADILFRKGITHGEQFLAAGKIDSEVQEWLLSRNYSGTQTAVFTVISEYGY